MALQTSGQISLNDIHVEAGGSSGSQATLNDSDIRDLIGKGSGSQMSFSEWYGATAETDLPASGTVNGQNQQKQITASSFISSGGTLVIPSNLWVWSDSRSTAALTIDIPCTVKNYGKIIGRGGDGYKPSSPSYATEGAGGPAIKINGGVTGVTIQNFSGAYIAGGGGGGRGGSDSFSGSTGGGGGAGGGTGGSGYFETNTPAGGALNGTGSVSSRPYASGAAGAGGGSSGSRNSANSANDGAASGGGGRILPGVGGAGGNAGAPGPGWFYNGRPGGSAGNAGTQGNSGTGGGGGGWGANGGGAPSGGPISGGKAIEDSGVSYTLSNSGTIYGGT